MNKIRSLLFIAIGCAMALTLTSARSPKKQTPPPPAPEPVAPVAENGDVEKVSEMLGYLIASNLDNPGFSFDLDAIIRGMHMAVDGEAPPMTDEEYQAAMQRLQEKAFDELSTTNKKEAEDFLAENKNHPAVVEIVPNKLQYRVAKPGSGPEVPEHASPRLHYTGKFADGTPFGSSIGNEPVVLNLDETVPGFQKGIAGMREGEKRILYVHPDLGYGTTGQLPPNALLIFEVEILDADTTDKS